MPDDVYATEAATKEHQLRYLNITVRNVMGILNRLTSLMRRKRYFIQEVSVSFDDADLAHIMFAVDGSKTDVAQAMQQLQKIHDVVKVEDMTLQKDLFFNMFYVTGTTPADLEGLPSPPITVIRRADHCIGIFIVQLPQTPAFASAAKEKGLSFRRRIVNVH